MTRSTWHDLTVTTITPAFLGKFEDGETGARIPFPVPSLRGVLAYWLRALAGAHVGENLSSLRKAESAVFGSARRGDSGGPSPIWLRGPLISLTQYPSRNPAAVADPDVAYLMGPGLRDRIGRYLPAGEQKLQVRNTGDPVHADLFLCALWGLQAFGGIGTRARRGFGTLSVTWPSGLQAERFNTRWLSANSPDDLPDVLACVADCLDDLAIPRTAETAQPGYPRFDLAKTWYLQEPDILIPAARSADEALAWAGARLREFRINSDEHPNTAGYREVVRPYLAGQRPAAEYAAGTLGLPVVYTQKKTERNPDPRSATVEPVIDGQPSRRASPLWLRVYGKGTTWKLRSLAFNAVWLPDPERNLRIRETTEHAALSAKQVIPPSKDTIHAELARWFSFISAQSPA